MTSAPTALGRTSSMNWRTTGRATSASSSAVRTSRSAASTSASVSAPRPRSRSNTSPRRLLRPSNILLPRPRPPKQISRRCANLRGSAELPGGGTYKSARPIERPGYKACRPRSQKGLPSDANPLIQNNYRPIPGWSLLVFLAACPLLGLLAVRFLPDQEMLTILGAFFVIGLGAVVVAVAPLGKAALPAL